MTYHRTTQKPQTKHSLNPNPTNNLMLLSHAWNEYLFVKYRAQKKTINIGWIWI